jgi:hypothetical protein
VRFRFPLLSGVSKTVHQPIDGLLGTDFFRRRIVQIDFATRKVRVLDHAQPNARGAVLPMCARRTDNTKKKAS